jgi:hypothetical protein
MRIVRAILLILLLVVCSSQIKKINLTGSVEKFQDPFERSYYPIWTGAISYCFKDSTKYLEFSGWGDADRPTFVCINITFSINALWISINPLYADIYNPTIQAGYTFQIFHPPRN